MNRPADFHTHSLFSSDSDAKPEENIKAAINLGLSSICFTEHNDFDFPPEDNKDVLFQLDFAAPPQTELMTTTKIIFLIL